MFFLDLRTHGSFHAECFRFTVLVLFLLSSLLEVRKGPHTDLASVILEYGSDEILYGTAEGLPPAQPCMKA
eukprot:scaffold1033_cov171-Amphora_coffeaeformis.AAC.13